MACNPHPDANQISALLGGELQGTLRRDVLDHLSGCEVCRQWTACSQLASGREIVPAEQVPVRAWSGFWRVLPPALAAGVALAASGLWMQRATLHPQVFSPTANLAAVSVSAKRRLGTTLPARNTPASAGRATTTVAVLRSAPAAPAGAAVQTANLTSAAAAPIAAGAGVQAPAEFAPAGIDTSPEVVSATAVDWTRVATDAPPSAAANNPTVQTGTFQPSMDFSPLTTGFQDQPVIILRPELAKLSFPVPTASRPARVALVTAPAPTTASVAAMFGDSFNAYPMPAAVGSSRPSPRLSAQTSAAGPTGLGWALARSGDVLRSIGTGLWATVPTVHGLHLRTLFASGKVLWAGDTAAELFVSRDHGSHWLHVSLAGSDAHATISGLSFTDAQHGQITLSDGNSWRTSDSGQSWQHVAAGH